MQELSPEAINGVVVLFVDYGLNILGALALLIAGWIAASWAKRATRRTLERTVRIDATLKPIVANTAHYAILVVVLIAVLARFGVQTASILAVIGAAGLAIGLAIQGTLSNLASGVMLLFLRPFSVGDYIDAEGIAGTIREIGLFATELETFDGVYVMAPNSQIFSKPIRNYSRLPMRRVDVPVGVSYGDDLEKALSVALAVIEADLRILKNPAAETMVMNLGDSAVQLNLRCWTDRDSYWSVFFGLQKAIKLELDRAGITIPFPQRVVHFTGKE